MFQKLVFSGMQKGGVNSNIRLSMVHNLNFQSFFYVLRWFVIVVLGLELLVSVVKVKSLRKRFLLCFFFAKNKCGVLGILYIEFRVNLNLIIYCLRLV
jgi:hypothetical protein